MSGPSPSDAPVRVRFRLAIFFQQSLDRRQIREIVQPIVTAPEVGISNQDFFVAARGRGYYLHLVGPFAAVTGVINNLFQQLTTNPDFVDLRLDMDQVAWANRSAAAR